MIPFVATRTGLNVYVDGKPYSIGNDHPNYQTILGLVQDTNSKVDDIRDLVDISKAIERQTFGKVVVEGETIKYGDRAISAKLTKRILAVLKEGQKVDIFVAFLDNLFLNPSYRAVNELFGFLEACTLPLTADGCFLAYKKVRFNYVDIHSGTFDNSIGKKPSMPRNMVDEDSNRTCSSGLHVCSFGYLGHFGGTGTQDTDDRVVIVKVNPKDVVAVPADYNNQKMRVCEYEVVDELPNDGITQLVDWVYGKRDVAFLRNTLTELKTLAKETFALEDFPVTTFNLKNHDTTEVRVEEFLTAVKNKFGLKTEIASFGAKYAGNLTIKNLLQWVSNFS